MSRGFKRGMLLTKAMKKYAEADKISHNQKRRFLGPDKHDGHRSNFFKHKENFAKHC